MKATAKIKAYNKKGRDALRRQGISPESTTEYKGEYYPDKNTFVYLSGNIEHRLVVGESIMIKSIDSVVDNKKENGRNCISIFKIGSIYYAFGEDAVTLCSYTNRRFTSKGVIKMTMRRQTLEYIQSGNLKLKVEF